MISEAYIQQSYIDSFGSDYGAAIYVSDQISIIIEQCSFSYCISGIEGGAIYFVGIDFIYSENSAENCFIWNFVDNKFGNLLKAICSQEGIFNLSSTCMCGPNLNVSSDCTTCILGNKNEMKSSNFSECYSNYGTSGPFFLSQCNALDIIVYHGDSYYAIFFEKGGITEKTVVVNSMISEYIFYSYIDSFVKDSLILASCSSNKIANDHIIFQNCFGNITTTGITNTQTYFNVLLLNCLHFKDACTRQKPNHFGLICFFDSITL